MKFQNTRFSFLVIFLFSIAAHAAGPSMPNVPERLPEPLTAPRTLPDFAFRICFKGPHARCFEGLTAPGKIRQYGGRTDSEATVSAVVLKNLTLETETVLRAAEASVKSLGSAAQLRCTQPLKFQLRTREAVVCLDQLEAQEKLSAKAPKVLGRLLALIDTLSLQSKPKK